MLYLPENHWVCSEFEVLDLGDMRLSDRFLQTAYFISENLGASIFKACQRWSQAKGAYRMFNNPKVTQEEIFIAHQEKTVKRVEQAAEVILAIQDTTFLNFNERSDAEGFGHIGTVGQNHSQGLVMHTTLAFDVSQGVVLGLLDQTIWSRESKPKVKVGRKHKRLPIEQKESMKWLRALRTTQEVLNISKRVVTVADRESDVFEFIQDAQRLNADFVIRAVRNRRIETAGGESLIWTELSSQDFVGEMKVLVPARAGRKKRLACVGVKYCPLIIKPTKERPSIKKAAPIGVFGILVKEMNPPPGEEGLEWVLLTNLKVERFEDAVEKVNWYKSRWQIEVFHKILKSVCRVESCGLRTAEHIKKFAALASINAWRLHWMLHVSRAHPNKSCTEILEAHEWKVLCALASVKSKYSRPPTLQEAVRWIAQLGGFAARTSDGAPGAITLARGWEILRTTLNHWAKLKKIENCG